MAKTSLFMETTKVSPAQSAAEITSVLVAYGATSINTDYQSGKITGLRWTMKVGGADVLFDMPARVEPVLKRLQREYPGQNADRLKEKAERIAWRQLYRWTQAQMAMITLGMAQAAEVFMPYIVMNPGRSGQRLFEVMLDQQFKALPSGEKR